jgi:hypothetical protein
MSSLSLVLGPCSVLFWFSRNPSFASVFLPFFALSLSLWACQNDGNLPVQPGPFAAEGRATLGIVSSVLEL